MPTVSDKQAKFMRAVAHSPSFAKQVGVPQKVGKEFMNPKAKGGVMAKKMDAETKREMAFMKAKKAPASMMKAEMKEEGMKKGGMIKKAAGGKFRSVADGIAKKGKTKGMEPKMACGGKAMKKGK